MTPNYDRYPTIRVPAADGGCDSGWDAIFARIAAAVPAGSPRKILCFECYTGVFAAEIIGAARRFLPDPEIVESGDAFLPEDEIRGLIAPFAGGDDPLFGRVSDLEIDAWFAPEKLAAVRRRVESAAGWVVIVGPGASVISRGDVLIYADLPRWEYQLRMRRGEISALGLASPARHKLAYFIDWRVCDRLKKRVFPQAAFVLDTTIPGAPKLLSQAAVRECFRRALGGPFRVVPFFDPAPWGGKWMKETFGLPDGPPNYGWAFDCVPEENSVLFEVGGIRVELPAIDLVFHDPETLLGPAIRARFGDEFPIRFNLLDTIGGGNLSFQVHPQAGYTRETFGMPYTQEESYYLLAADPGAEVWLGLREDARPEEMFASLTAARDGGPPFDPAKFACHWPARSHDHFLIPPGTVHCSAAGCVVLEISATPNVFTFKLWDLGRLGLDGKPRPINLAHGAANIDWQRTEKTIARELVNVLEPLASGDGWTEERTGLHPSEFIETRRHRFTAAVPHDTRGTLNVINLVQGREAVVESPAGAFDPFIVHFAETFIVPAAVGKYTIRPHGEAAGTTCMTLKAFVKSPT